MTDKKKYRQRSFRLEETVCKWFDDRDIKLQGVVTRLLDNYIQTKETEEKKLANYNNLAK